MLPNLILLFFTLNFSHTDYVLGSVYHIDPPIDSIGTSSCIRLNLSNTECSKLTPSEKRELFLASVAQPAFLFANTWNDQIVFGKYPIGEGKSVASIKDAWIKILPPSPSVMDNETKKIYTPSEGNLQVAYAFSYVVPFDNSTECPNQYQPIGYDYNLTIYQDGGKINEKDLNKVKFSLPNKNSIFEAVLGVNSAYIYDKYSLETECDKNSCTKVCKYVESYTMYNTLTVKDTLPVEKADLNAKAQVLISNNENGIWDVSVLINKSAPANIDFHSEYSTFYYKNYAYFLNAYSAYNILQPSFRNVSEFSQQNFVLEEMLDNGTKIRGFMPAPEDIKCTVRVSSHFSSYLFDACSTFNKNATLSLNFTDVFNDTVRITGTLKDDLGNPINNNTIFLKYLGNDFKNSTDNEGNAYFTIPFQKGYYVVEAWSSSNGEYRISKATGIIPNHIDYGLLFNDLILFGAFFIAFKTLIKGGKKMYGA